MATRLWPGQDALGKRFREALDGGPLIEVVGIVADARYHMDDLRQSVRPRYFLSLDQFFRYTRVLHVRAADAMTPQALTAMLESTLRRLDASVPVYDLFTLDYQMSVGPNGFGLTLTAAFVTGVLGILALLLALVGMYGVLSFAVGQRTHEIGIRMALGARAGQVAGMVLRQTWGFAATGLVLGLGLSLALGQGIRGFLFGVVPNDAATIAAVAVLVSTVTTAVGYLPARRASRIDPMQVLRHE
jgi:ABC-type antimicrobial peptide transport system permease subunit